MKKKYGTAAVMILGVALIVVGILLEQNQAVLQKAIRICMECVGIG